MRIVLKGTVQGVGFRPTVYRVAKSLGLKGYVKNLGSEVEVLLDKDEDKFLKDLRKNLPPLAEITKIERYEQDVDHDDFEIVPSSDGERESSTIPVDTAVCDDCLEELFDPEDRRYDFPFINCTNCGARYTAIQGLPYDREKTTMAPFPMCGQCLEEYKDASNRRFHAQTTSCPECGPSYTLYNSKKENIGGVNEFCELIKEGKLGVAKSWGGMHIVCKLEKIPDLRKKYGRKEKPFALMMRDVETVRKYAEVEKEDVLTGPRRPIMIYNKKDHEKDLLDHAAPGLPTIGVMLPYTGLHHLLFKKIDEDALVMTSANYPGEPMIIKNEKAFELGLEYLLLHNRTIANRVDDSLIRVHGENLAPIRRSRGFVPKDLGSIEGNVMGAGADKSGCVTLSSSSKLYPSQYLGDLGSYNGRDFYKDTVSYLTDILGITSIDGVGVDLHPKYQSRKLGTNYAEQFDAEIFEIQHHWAHGASLLFEYDLEEIICISVDGTGYGEDGNSWGGEILYCTPTNYKRLAHLEPFPLLGGERAIEDPRRLVHAIYKQAGYESGYFTSEERRVLNKIMKDSVKTTSLGRLLDAVSCVLDVCCERTYEGEPAMKLERLQMEGRDRKNYDIYQNKDTICTLDAFIEMKEDDLKKTDKAASYTSSVANKIADIAVRLSEERNTENIGISGGVSYNRPIVEAIRKHLTRVGKKLYVHEKVPNGDMGVPIGQAYIVSSLLKEQ